MSRNSDVAAQTSRPSWHERIMLALGAYRDWMHVTPAEYWMDKSMKAAGFREVITENSDLRAENKRLRELAVEVAEASDLHEWGHAVTKARALIGAETT